jgi:hypothetical protein
MNEERLTIAPTLYHIFRSSEIIPFNFSDSPAQYSMLNVRDVEAG